MTDMRGIPLWVLAVSKAGQMVPTAWLIEKDRAAGTDVPVIAGWVP